ncbi:MAG: hypothetical protein QOI66_3394 [Myxococcales bacterium]|jgi:hypothetical protein|nr:hypothetical protein [Myxococcales bacterium]
MEEHRRAFRGTFIAGVLVSVCAAPTIGCGGNLHVRKIDSAAQPTGNVAVYFTVNTAEDKPVPDLNASSFRVYEDGKLIPEKKGKRALLDPRVAMSQSTLVLVDMAGPIADSEDMPTLVTAVGRLCDRVGRLQEVAVSAFDGGPDLVPVLTFEANDVRGSLDGLRAFRPRSRQSNLNGAIVKGLEVVRHRRDDASVPHAFGNLVVFTDRGDLAHKVSGHEVQAAIEKSGINVYVIGIGERVKKEELEPLGHGETFLSAQTKDLTRAFSDVSKKLDAMGASHYVLSYCSPKRKGTHTLEVEVLADGDSGRLKQKFQADDFDPSDCAPRKRPVFGQAVATRGGKSKKEN